jgi:hypothetical protein
MAETYRITCVRKSDGRNPHERIRKIGGPAGGGWTLTQEDAIAGIEAGKWRFFVSVDGVEVWVTVGRYLGREYLKTLDDSLHPDTLLGLPECR